MNLNIKIESLNKYKNRILNSAIIIIALIIAGNIYKNQSLKAGQLLEKKEMETKKNAVLGNISRLEKKFSAYKKFVNKKDISAVINTINNIARESGVKINSIKPQPELEEADYIKYPFLLAVNAKDYHSLGGFISKLESSPDIYAVENINIRLITEQQKIKDIDEIAVDLAVSTCLLK